MNNKEWKSGLNDRVGCLVHRNDGITLCIVAEGGGPVIAGSNEEDPKGFVRDNNAKEIGYLNDYGEDVADNFFDGADAEAISEILNDLYIKYQGQSK